MYKNSKAKVNGYTFKTRKTENFSIQTVVGTTGFKKDQTRFCLKLSVNPKADLIAIKTEEGILLAGCGGKSLHDFRDALAFALNTINYQIKEAQNG